jgi:hypothetical protein
MGSMHPERCRRGSVKQRRNRRRLMPGLFVFVAVGCSHPVKSQLRDGTPEEAAARVMESVDADKDGKIVAQELASSPGLADGLPRIDANRDRVIDLSEMTARFAAHDKQSKLVALQVSVTAKRSPLDGAVVTFTPEPFMGEGKQAYIGTTSGGSCSLQGQDVKLPGLPAGYYKVQIVHAASGTDVTRGVEVADDTPSPNRLTFDTQVAPKQPAVGMRQDRIRGATRLSHNLNHSSISVSSAIEKPKFASTSLAGKSHRF